MRIEGKWGLDHKSLPAMVCVLQRSFWFLCGEWITGGQEAPVRGDQLGATGALQRENMTLESLDWSGGSDNGQKQADLRTM